MYQGTAQVLNTGTAQVLNTGTAQVLNTETSIIIIIHSFCIALFSALEHAYICYTSLTTSSNDYNASLSGTCCILQAEETKTKLTNRVVRILFHDVP